MIPIYDSRRIVGAHRNKISYMVKECIDSGRYILGPEVEAFESQFAAFTDAKHAVGVSSGTDALLTALMALKMTPGSEVIVTPFTFIASATSILRSGHRVKFADVAAGSFMPGVKEYEKAITRNTKAIMVVHIFGEPQQDMDEIQKLCDSNGLYLIEDCAQATGTRYGDLHVGNHGDVGCFSFFPAKNLGCLGDGGMVITNDDALAEKMKKIRNHGSGERYQYEMLGGNFRLDAIQAVALQVLLPYTNKWMNQRRRNAKEYQKNLSNIESIKLPECVDGHSWNQFTLRVPKRRDELKSYLDENGVGCAVYYPKSLHREKMFDQHTRRLKNCDKLADEVLSIPIYAGLTVAERDTVIDVLKEFSDE